MAINDPISDMVTRIRNALANKAKSVDCVNSHVCRGIASVLRDEGYIDGFDVVEDGRGGKLKLKLKYGPRGEHVIHRVVRQSKPGCRVYRKVDELPRPLQGLGICVVSTSKGVLSDRKCRTEKVGGELLCIVE
ncbi:MAG: 30S ribosomal protein S8 [Planctomycetaceae bacterium]|jgi:small subunit ribosomal protein S8|nr:30S ribosomal protein S8 [Phycisphaerales bacterium]MCE2652311.1 30S ribosomal protein S8 [Planctomycetaceae bacterium]